MCKASPQTLQYDPWSGRSAIKQFSHTGSRETSMRGEPQIRQSEGKTVKNKFAAARLARPTNPGCANSGCADPWFAAWPWAARIRNPVLLKTASGLRPADDACRILLSQYSRRAPPMQRVYPASNRPAFHSPIACAQAEGVRAREPYARRKPGDSNAHNARLGATEREARVFRESCVDVTDKPPASHIPGSKIPQTDGSKRAWKGVSRKCLLAREWLPVPKTRNQGQELPL